MLLPKKPLKRKITCGFDFLRMHADFFSLGPVLVHHLASSRRMKALRRIILAAVAMFALAGAGERIRAQQNTPASTAPRPAEPEYAIAVTTDRPDATYKQGEIVTFRISITHQGAPMEEGTVAWSVTKDGVPPVQSGVAEVKNGQASVTGQLAEPGFLQCKAIYKGPTGKDEELARGIGGAAVDPQLIRPSMPVPEDFDAFWAAQRKRLAAVPLNAKMTPVTFSTATNPPGSPESATPIEIFDVQADAIGDTPMRGYFARPAGARPKSLPAIITLEGAGVYATRRDPWLTGWARDGFLSLEINAHGIANDKPQDFYLGLEKGALKDYQIQGRNSRDTFYFLNMYLRAQRGLDFLAAQPEWDGKILISSGTSQGGAQSIFLAGIDPRVTFLLAAVPAMCDHSGMVTGRVPGWPRLVPLRPDGKPDPAVLETSRYFDSVNFCTRVRVPSLFVAGFIDQVTPPTSVYAAFNALPGAGKEMYPATLSPHRIDPRIWPEIRRRVLLHKNAAYTLLDSGRRAPN